MDRQVSRRQFLRSVALAAAGTAAIACQPQTVVIEKEVTKVVKETVMVAGTPVEVTKVVQEKVEVEKVVEKVVTATPVPEFEGISAHQAPMLQRMVKDRALPPLEQRLPTNPAVVTPRSEVGETIGRYGGTLSVMEDTPFVGHHTPESGHFWGTEGLATWDSVAKVFTPNVADWWELSDDYKTLTIHLREGVKWSDGAPLTTEDVLFWWEDVILNEELTPQVPSLYVVGGEAPDLIIEDEYTFRFEWPLPYVAAVDGLDDMQPWAPKHYLKQWHITHNENANLRAEAEGYEQWWEAFTYHQDLTQLTIGLPVLAKWIQEEVDATGTRHFVRNPYYWKVDPEGNQLPYADRYQRVLVGSMEILEAKAIAGEYNFGGAYVSLKNYSLLKESEEKAGYKIYLYTSPSWGSSISFCFNYTSKDPVFREIFNDLRFRKAISYSLDRNEYNEIYNLGLAKPRQGLAPPSWSFYEEGLDQTYTEYDPDLANELLDEMGLEWDANHEWRLRPDGKRMSLFTLNPGGVQREGIELLVKYWKALGIEFIIKPAEAALFREQLLASELDVATWGAGGPDEVGSHAQYPIRLAPPWHWRDCCALAASEWYDWWYVDPKGSQGEEPPELIQHLFEVVDEWQATPRGTDRYMELGKEMNHINAENIWWFILTGLAPGIEYLPAATTIGLEVHNMMDPDAPGVTGQDSFRSEILWIDEEVAKEYGRAPWLKE